MDENKMNTNLTLDLSSLSKKRILVDGDENRVLLLNLSDMNVVVRLKEKYEELSKLEKEALVKLSAKEPESDEEVKDSVFSVAEAIAEIDAKMREIMDYIFDSNVSEVCAPSGSMFDFINGKARYEHIFDAIVQLYDDNITSETKKIEKRVNNNKHTQMYVKKK